MSQAVTEAPFKIEHYNFSWGDTRKHIDSLVNRFSDNYKIAYFNDFHQRLILLINHEPQLFGSGNPQVLSILKIDSCADLSLLIFEITGNSNKLNSKEAHDKGWAVLQKISTYLRKLEK